MGEDRKNTRVAVVTGAARGIGRRTALVLAEHRYAVAANDLSSPKETLDELERMGAEAVATSGDVSDEEAVREIVRTTVDSFGRVDVLVNNAGVSLISPAENTTLSDWQRVLEINLTGRSLCAASSARRCFVRAQGA
jgi:NAD(P)-dependent dehydrogenase (short-subunit alcohol dehydrogenase family)